MKTEVDKNTVKFSTLTYERPAIVHMSIEDAVRNKINPISALKATRQEDKIIINCSLVDGTENQFDMLIEQYKDDDHAPTSCNTYIFYLGCHEKTDIYGDRETTDMKSNLYYDHLIDYDEILFISFSSVPKSFLKIDYAYRHMILRDITNRCTSLIEVNPLAKVCHE